MLSSGTRLGPYEIVSRLGAGGMGEVFRARDTRLDRSVAIKVLPSAFSSNESLRRRFEREARVISQLNHPNICTLHDVGSDDGVDYLVMELIDGETLADRIARGPLPMPDVLRYGAEIAHALHIAHRAGIVHRDLKPGNIMITKSGAKLLDFGLAKLVTAPVAGGDDPTVQKPMTAEGTILGTFQYMAPEQLEGLEADPRTDIFALGAVLYEMATAKRAFEGKTKTSLIASIIRDEPRPIAQLQPLTPPSFEHVVAKCLRKDPEERWQSAHDVGSELEWISEGAAPGAVQHSSPSRKIARRMAWFFGLAMLATAATFAALWLREKNEVRPAVTSWMVPPDGVRFVPWGGVVLSPDGSRCAFIGIDASERRQIYVRAIGDLMATALQGTNDVEDLFWSPDGKHIGYFTNTKLKRVPVSGGASQVLASVETPRGGSWSIDGTIVYAPSFRDGLFKVSSSGGVSARLTHPDRSKGDINHRHPRFLPDGKHLLFLAQRAEGGAPDDPSTIDILSLEDGRRRQLVRSNSSVLYAPPDYVLYAHDNTLMAQRLNVKSLALEGEPLAVAQDVAFSGSESVVASVSLNGMLTYMPGGNLRRMRLIWVDRGGKEIGRYNEEGAFVFPALSPDGTKVAVELNEGSDDIWVIDIARQSRSRVTTDPGDEYTAVWSPDGKRIAFGSNRIPVGLWLTSATGRSEENLVEGNNIAALDWSRADEILVAYFNGKLGWDLGIVSPSQRRIESLLSSRFNEGDAQFSPDARAIAFTSDQSGRDEVYVLIRETGERLQLSTNGGSGPRWNPDGSEIFYISADRKLTAVTFRTNPSLEAGIPVSLFDVRTTQYDVASGIRFLLVVPVSADRQLPSVLVQNWPSLLQD